MRWQCPILQPGGFIGTSQVVRIKEAAGSGDSGYGRKVVRKER